MEIKDLTDYLGIDGKDLAEFKSKFTEKYISKKDDDAIKELLAPELAKATGKIKGTIDTIVKREFGLTNEDLEGKKYEEVLVLAASKTKTEITTLKESYGKDNDQKIKDLEAKLEKTNKTLTEEKEAKELLKTSLEAKENDFNTKIKGFKIDSVLKAAKEKIAPNLIDLSEEQKFFFDNKINSDFKIDLDEKENPIVLGSDGKRIPNPNKAGDFLGLEDAILKIAEEKKYVKKNAGGTISNNLFVNPNEKKTEVTDSSKERKVHPNAQKKLVELKETVAAVK